MGGASGRRDAPDLLGREFDVVARDVEMGAGAEHLRGRGAARIKGAGPAIAAPTGAPRPFEKQIATVSKCRAQSRAGTPEATTAFINRAPSRCMASPCPRAQAEISATAASG